MDGHRVALIGHAHGQVVGGDGAELCDEEVWRDLVAQFLYRADGPVAVPECDEVFRLQLFAAGGRELHFEVRQA